MFFKKMTMHGFKSFADPVTIDFDSGITCIVGPNGSGKSNISDALRWVLGEQSPKMLRGGKMDEIIFAGTDTRKSRGMAEVTLVIDNSDKRLDIDFVEVSITRRMYRTGESEYFINNSQCRLRDIRELIMDTGIGVDGYSIIGQGKIAEIINGKPDTRREIFEEAAGIVKYRTKKAETERKLESTAANLTRVNDIISELEGRVAPLQEESRKAKEYLEISKKYKENEINVILRNIELTDKQNAILTKDMADTQKLVDETEEKLSEIDGKIRRNKARSDELDLEDQQERERLMNMAYELNDLKNRMKIDTERISSLKKGRNLFSDEVKTLIERIAREETNKKALERKLEDLNNQSLAVDQHMNDLQKKFNEEEKLVNEKESEFENFRDSLYELSMKSSSKKAEIEGLENILNTLSKRRNELNDESALSNENDALEAELLRKKHDLTDVNRQKNEAFEKQTAIRRRIFELNEKEESSRAECGRLKTSLHEEQTRKDMLVQLENSYEGYNYAVRFIMTESNIRGIYGTVGSLIKAPRGYETAIETALGGRLQNIICEDDDSAKKAINQLKARKAGRLTFLPLTSLRVAPRKNDGELTGEPGFVGIAADVVEFDGVYKNAVEYLLGGIVIMKTLDDAMAISKKHRGYRYVTMEGELINPSGAVTGGAYKNNNTSGLLERKNRLNAADKVIFQLKDEYGRAEKALIRLRDEIETEKQLLEEADRVFHDLEIKAVNCKNEYDALEEKNSGIAERNDRRSSELSRLEAEIEHTKTLISEARADFDNTELRIDDIKKRTELLADERDDLKKSAAHLSEQLLKVRIDSEGMRGDLSSLQDQINRSHTAIVDLNKEMETKNQNIKNSDLEQESIEFRMKGTLQEIEMCELKNKDQSSRLNDIKNEKADLSKAYDNLLSEKEGIDKTVYMHKNRKYDIELKLRSGETRVDDWKNKIWEEFEISYLEALDMKHPAFDLNEGVKSSRSMRKELRELGDVNVNAIAEYEEVRKRYDFLTGQRKDLMDASSSLKSIITETDNLIRSNFEITFNHISRNFKNVFKELFGGGDAEIRIEPDVDPLEAEIDIVAQPPGKKLQNMNLLSGGEKTMTAIALMFAVLKTKPTPFCILDEIEAALDEANIDRFGDYLKNLGNIQFVLVTHSKVTMEHANVLYGVTMPERGISKVLSLKLADAEAMEGLS